MEWIIWKASNNSESPVKSEDVVCVRFAGETREEALDRGFEINCDTLIWHDGLGNGNIIEYIIKIPV